MPQSEPSNIYERFGVTAMADEGIRPGGLKLTARALDFCRFPPRSAVLDVGCGNGVTVDYLRTEHDLWAFGIDASHVLAAIAQRRRIPIPLAIGTAEKLPFPDNAFDGLFLECTLSLLKDRNAVLAECHRVVRTGGKIVVTDVHVRNPAGLAGLGKLPSTSCLRGAEVRSVLQDRVHAAGFEIELWEDHSELLKEFAIEIVWTMGSMGAFWGLAGDQGINRDVIGDVIRRARPGYHMLIGQKTDTHRSGHLWALPACGAKDCP